MENKYLFIFPVLYLSLCLCFKLKKKLGQIRIIRNHGILILYIFIEKENNWSKTVIIILLA